MKEDLDLSGDRYEWLLSAFYVTYIVSGPLHRWRNREHSADRLPALSMVHAAVEGVSST